MFLTKMFSLVPCRVCINLALLVLCERPLSILSMIHCGRTHPVTCRSSTSPWLARKPWPPCPVVVIALQMGRLCHLRNQHVVSPLLFARKPATDLPPVPVTLPEGSASSPKRHGRPPKVAPLRDDVAGPRASWAVG